MTILDVEDEELAQRKPALVATTSIICDLARQIAENQFFLACLVPPGQEPHTYEPTPQDRADSDDADLILCGGYHFAPDLEALVAASSNSAPKVAVFEAAVPAPLMSQARHCGHDDKHHDEDPHNCDELVVDPHVWHSASNGVELVKAIAAQLVEAFPDSADAIRANELELVEELASLHEWIQVQVAAVPEGDRRLVTTHASFGYFANAYRFEVAGALSGISNEKTPSAGRMAELIDLVQDSGVKAIVAETTTNRDSIETVARDAGVIVPEQPLYVEGPGGKGTPAVTYQQMLEVNTCAIVDGLGGECSDFS
ncbi:MAG: zinc ABC transporter substrate-binding protein [Synechococcus sp.]